MGSAVMKGEGSFSRYLAMVSFKNAKFTRNCRVSFKYAACFEKPCSTAAMAAVASLLNLKVRFLPPVAKMTSITGSNANLNPKPILSGRHVTTRFGIHSADTDQWLECAPNSQTNSRAVRPLKQHVVADC